MHQPDVSVLLPAVAQWAASTSTEAAHKGRLLTESEADFARKIGIICPQHVHVWVVKEMPPVPDELKQVSEQFLDISHAAGLTLGYAILVVEGQECPSLVRHELGHVLQVERVGGMMTFLKLYMDQILAFGYENAPFETEARNYESD